MGAFLLLLPLGKYISIQAQVLIPFVVSAIIVVLQAWVAYSTQLSGNLVIFTTLLSSGLLGFVTAAMTSATYAVATYLPSIYIQVNLPWHKVLPGHIQYFLQMIEFTFYCTDKLDSLQQGLDGERSLETANINRTE